MDRRKFFRNLLGGTAAVAIGPKVFDQIVEQDYSMPNKTPEEVLYETASSGIPSKEMPLPFGGSGIWVFKDEKLIAYGGATGVTISINLKYSYLNRPLIEMRSDAMAPIFIGGLPEGSWHIEDFHIIDDSAFKNNDVVHIVFKHPEKGTIESDAIFTAISYAGGSLDHHIQTTADFAIVGEMTIYHD